MAICTDCGQEHPLDRLEVAFHRPDVVAEVGSNERQARVQEGNDLCVLDGKRFFVRALLPLPVADSELPYNIGLWVEVSRRDFERVYELWDSPEQSQEPAFLAHVANDISIHPPVSCLEGMLSLTGRTTRPILTLRPAEHPLVGEQVRGITPHRVAEYSRLFTEYD
jgi:hypothetical protein